MAAHVNFSMRDSGFVIHSAYPEIGASPDGIVQCDCCGEGSLEVKCPFLIRNEDLLNVKEGVMCLTKDDSGSCTWERHTPTTIRCNASCLCVATLVETLLCGPRSPITASGLPKTKFCGRKCCQKPAISFK